MNGNSINISILYRMRKKFMLEQLRPHGVLGEFYFVVVLLSEKEGISQEQIASALKYDKATVTNALKKLEREGYVKRTVNEDDRRFNQVYLTEKSARQIFAIEEAMQQWQKKIMAGIPENIHLLVEDYLRQMAENAAKI